MNEKPAKEGAGAQWIEKSLVGQHNVTDDAKLSRREEGAHRQPGKFATAARVWMYYAE